MNLPVLPGYSLTHGDFRASPTSIMGRVIYYNINSCFIPFTIKGRESLPKGGGGGNLHIRNKGDCSCIVGISPLQSRGVWGHAPPEIFGILDTQRAFLKPFDNSLRIFFDTVTELKVKDIILSPRVCNPEIFEIFNFLGVFLRLF